MYMITTSREYGCRLERYKDLFGHNYPEAILVDTINRNRKNWAFCKEYGIRLFNPELGTSRKDRTGESDAQVYKDSCDHNKVEGCNGIGMRRYVLDLIMDYLAETEKTEASRKCNSSVICVYTLMKHEFVNGQTSRY